MYRRVDLVFMEYALILPTLRQTELIAFQRRDDKAPTEPNLLGLFGGGIEAGETPPVAALREINEETSLGVAAQELRFCFDADMPTERGMARAYLFMVGIMHTDFEVYEGSGFEMHSRVAALKRADLSPGAGVLLRMLDVHEP
jgi:8-oxo-dGTP pyrophosphatase MutT (NUDIX family)